MNKKYSKKYENTLMVQSTVEVENTYTYQELIREKQYLEDELKHITDSLQAQINECNELIKEAKKLGILERS
jgi:tryptophanase